MAPPCRFWPRPSLIDVRGHGAGRFVRQLLAAATVAGAASAASFAAYRQMVAPAPSRLPPLFDPLFLAATAATVGGGRRILRGPLADRTPDSKGIIEVPFDEMDRWFWEDVVPNEDVVCTHSLEIRDLPDLFRVSSPRLVREGRQHVTFSEGLASLTFDVERAKTLDPDEALLRLREVVRVRDYIGVVQMNRRRPAHEGEVVVELAPLLEGLTPEGREVVARVFRGEPFFCLSHQNVTRLIRDYDQINRMRIEEETLEIIPLLLLGLDFDHERMCYARPSSEEGLVVLAPPASVEEVARHFSEWAHPSWRPVRFVPYFPDPAHHPTDPETAGREYAEMRYVMELRDLAISFVAQGVSGMLMDALKGGAVERYRRAEKIIPIAVRNIQSRLRKVEGNLPMTPDDASIPPHAGRALLRLYGVTKWFSYAIKMMATELVWGSELFVPPVEREKLIRRLETVDLGDRRAVRALRQEIEDAYLTYFPWGAEMLKRYGGWFDLGVVGPLERPPSPPAVVKDHKPSLAGDGERAFREFEGRAKKNGVVDVATAALYQLLLGMERGRQADGVRRLKGCYRPSHFDFDVLREYDPAGDPQGVALRKWLEGISLDDRRREASAPPLPPKPPPPSAALVVGPVPSQAPARVAAVPAPPPPRPERPVPWYEQPGHRDALDQVRAALASLGKVPWEIDRLTLALSQLGEGSRFDRAVEEMRALAVDPEFRPVLERDSANPNFLRYLLLAVDLASSGHLKPTKLRRIAAMATALEQRMPEAGKVVHPHYWKVALVSVMPRFFRHRAFPLLAELEAVAHLSADPQVLTVEVLPEGISREADFLATMQDKTTIRVEVKSLHDSDEPVAVLVYDFEFKVRRALDQLRVGRGKNGRVVVYVRCRRPEREMTLVPAMDTWIVNNRKAIPTGVQVNVVGASQMRYFQP